jgi:galactonate dehydratase
MKIEKVEFFKVLPRWLFLKISTDTGITGWGEPVIEGRADTVASAVQEMEEYIIGQDPRNIEDLWQKLYRGGFYRGGPVLTSAISGIDQALWDIKGKDLGVSVHEMLGGKVRNKMKVYSWVGGDRPHNVAEAAKEKLSQGFKAIKMNGTENIEWIHEYKDIEAVLDRVQAVRDAVGYNLDIAIDFHGRVHKATAKVLLKELEPYKIMFVEEPILTENEEVFAELHRYTCIPLATGERNYTRWGFKNMLCRGSVDIIQPDVCHAGGISEIRKIATMAETFDVALAPHCPLGPIALASCLQVDFCSINAFIQEQSIGMHYNNEVDITDYLNDWSVFNYENGYVNILTKPGLGIEVNEEKIREMAKVGHHWKNPVWRNEDGSITEW